MEWQHIDPWANESKANVRWLVRRSGRTEEDCRSAIREARGNLQEALRRLAPTLHVNKFPDWYYLGPFKPVDDPDRDLPIREKDELSPCEIEYETDRKINGERLIAPFNDSNSIGDISGCILVTIGYPQYGDKELGQLQWSLAEAADRIREKVRRSKNPMRNGYFENAIRAIELAKDLFFDRRYEDAQKAAMTADNLLREGNKPRAASP